jgi:hypothetical protein
MKYIKYLCAYPLGITWFVIADHFGVPFYLVVIGIFTIVIFSAVVHDVCNYYNVR